MNELNDYIEKLESIFRSNEDMLANHKESESILRSMAANKSILHQIISKNISNPDFLNRTRHYSTLAMDIFENSEFSFVVNIFPALPDRNTEVSFQSIHHHGNMLLSTIGAFGPGYRAITFSPDFSIDKRTGYTKMKKEKIYTNNLLNYDFVSSNTPHVVFYPQEISATYALWSKNTKRDKATLAKKLPFVFKFKKQIKKAIEFVGAQKIAGLAKVEFYDFYPENGRLMAMKERVEYDGSKGSNQNFIKNIFHFIQKTDYSNVGLLLKLRAGKHTSDYCKSILDKYINNIEITAEFIEEYNNISKVNLLFEEVCQATS